MSQLIADTLGSARDAIRRRAWHEAHELFSAADSDQPLAPEDLEQFAQAAWWTGRLDHCIEVRQRAYAAYVDQGNPVRAAILAMELARDNFSKNASAVASGWLKRAERLLEEEPESVEHGWLERMRAVVAFEGRHDHDVALDHAKRALDIATRFRERDLMALSLHDQGRILVALGRVAEGTALMDEATVGAVGGELGAHTTAAIYCNMISICRDLADYARAGQWSEAAKRWCERQAISGFPGMCRVYRAEIMRLRGAWTDAEGEARRACQELREFNLGYTAAAFNEVGEVRLRLGDFSGAEDAFAHAHELGKDPEPGLSLLRLATGRVEAALASIKRALAEGTTDRLHRARLLPAQVEIALAAGQPEVAREATAELESIAADYGSAALEAAAFQARGALHLSMDDPEGAIASLRPAIQKWQEVDAPYEGARARLLMGLSLRAQGEEEAAGLELRAARSVFERLGAIPDTQRARKLLGEEQTAPGTVSTSAALMFTDMVKSTPLVEAIGDEAWGDLLGWHDQTLRSLFELHGGEEVDHTGDGFFVAFNDPSSAVGCAVAIQRALAAHRKAHGFAPRVRIAVHVAPALRSGRGFRGKGVHEAARVLSVADADEILVTQAVLEAGAVRFPASEPTPITLKGLSQPITVARIDWH